MMTNSDLFVDAINDARRHTPADHPTGGIDAFLRCAPGWPAVRLAQECAQLASQLTSADQSVLHARQGAQMVASAMDPPHLSSPLGAIQDTDGFPWGIDELGASRFVAVEDARPLSASCGTCDTVTLGDLGFATAVHLPLRAGNRTMGAFNLYWRLPGVEWDDTVGAVVRALGIFSLERISRMDGPRATSALHRSG